MVQRAEQQDGVDRPVGGVERPGVAERRGEGPVEGLGPPTGLFDVEGHGVDQADVVAVGREPLGVHPRPAADVEDGHGGVGGDPATHDLLGAEVLEHTGAAAEAVVLGPPVAVVVLDLGGERGSGVGHAPTVPDLPRSRHRGRRPRRANGTNRGVRAAYAA